LPLFHLASRPWGYLIVGVLAALLGLGPGAIIGYISADEHRVAEAPVVLDGRNGASVPVELPIIRSPVQQPAKKPEKVAEIPLAAPAVMPPPVAALDSVDEDGVDEDEADEVVALPHTDDPIAWERNAITVPDPAGRPMIAVVIDDLGLNRRNTVRTMRLPGPLTLAFMTYAEQLEHQTSQAHAAGHELMVHFPMEPKDGDFDTGPMALTRDLGDDEIRKRLNWGLDRFQGYVGVNNHMGSAFTEYERGMAIVLEELHKRGLLYLDSLTTQSTVSKDQAAAFGVPFAARHVFLDNVRETSRVAERLREVERIARRQGYAIAIGHPHGATIDALSVWLPKLEEMGFALVPVSLIIKHRQGS